MNDSSRTQGWAIFTGAGLLAFLFAIGILNRSYLALAIPVAVMVFFVLGLAAWVGYTIATINVQVDAEASAGLEPESDLPSESTASATDRSA
ncbi:MAG: hypothetical protein V3T33_06040 [Myxococcota bacterium]